jgi:hypothetical protein
MHRLRDFCIFLLFGTVIGFQHPSIHTSPFLVKHCYNKGSGRASQRSIVGNSLLALTYERSRQTNKRHTLLRMSAERQAKGKVMLFGFFFVEKPSNEAGMALRSWHLACGSKYSVWNLNSFVDFLFCY